METIYHLAKQDFNKEVKFLLEYLFNPTSSDNYNLIIPGLYLGNYEAACSKTFILDKEIDLVINCSNDLNFPKFYDNIINNKFRYIRIPLDDSKNYVDQLIMSLNMPKICPIIHKYLNKGQNVYIHCYAGMQRSATVVICYLIYLDKINNDLKKLNYYYNFLKSKRVVVFKPDPTFSDVILNYYKKNIKLTI